MKRLLIRPGALGDTIVWLPAAESCLRDGGEIWCAGTNVDVVGHLAPARAIEGSGLDLLELPGAAVPDGLIGRLCSFDGIISWYGTQRAEFREAIARLGVKVSFHAALPCEAGDLHAVDYYLNQVGAPPGGTPRVPMPRRDGGYAVIHPFSGSTKKNWPIERFREVASRVSGAMEVRWCAGPEEELEGAERFERVAELAVFLAGARVYLGNDSGPSHLAAAVGTPVVEMFGPSDPRVWAPRGEWVETFGFASGVDAVAAAVIRAGSRRRSG
ncbi:MAG TPA: glycosyltransferase family 9 protein [Bryobacteraceae bacterium]|nr:glycosyltransferase family 9 protein [Bryobacteraceae bacterium]